MKKANKQFIALLVCVIMSVALFASCGETPAPATATPSPAASPSGPPESGNDGEGDGETKADSPLPIVDDPVDITYWMPMSGKNPGGLIASFADIECIQIYETMSNVRVEWICPMSGEEKTQFSLMVAGGDFPDMAHNYGAGGFGATLYVQGAAQAIDDGIFLELTDIIDQYMPNYKREHLATDHRRQWTTMDDGRIWAIFTIYDTAEPHFRGPAINQQIWDEYSLESPVTLKDWDEAVTLLHNETGGYLFMDGSGLFPDSAFLSAWDVGNDFYVDKSGDIQFGPLQDGFREYLEMMNDWYNRGLIRHDFVSVSGLIVSASGDNRAKLLNGEYFAGVGNHSMLGNRYYSNGQSDNPDLWITPVAPPVHEEGEMVRFGVQLSAVKSGTNIFPTGKNIEVCAKWLDYFFSPEGQLFLNYGVEGQHWEYGDDGVIYTTDYLKYNDLDVPFQSWMQSKLFGYEFPGVTYLDYMLLLANNSGWREGEDPDMVLPPYTSFYGGSIWDGLTDNSASIPSGITTSAEDGAKFSKLYSDIETYVLENTARFITGEKPFSEFDAFRDQIRSMDIQTCIGIKQSAYTAFMSR